MMKHIFTAVMTLMLMMTYSCSSDEPSGAIPSNACYDFVTYEGVSDNATQFSMQKSNDSAIINYHCAQTFQKDSGIETGDRLIIAYTPSQNSSPYTSGEITMYGYRVLDNTNKAMTIESEPVYNSNPVKLQSLTRTGNYINFQAQLYCAYSANPKKLELVTTEDDLHTSYPTLHVVYEAQAPGENTMTGYASFDISQVWQLESCKGIIISNDAENFTFNK